MFSCIYHSPILLFLNKNTCQCPIITALFFNHLTPIRFAEFIYFQQS
ncbi:MAG: hypothetical protein DRH03_02885 [Deltaproteobacteria bacterium]|nr:MAG: hypothetical protein DRH03_02885 [Deltaproteobacteria bacterium]